MEPQKNPGLVGDFPFQTFLFSMFVVPSSFHGAFFWGMHQFMMTPRLKEEMFDLFWIHLNRIYPPVAPSLGWEIGKNSPTKQVGSSWKGTFSFCPKSGRLLFNGWEKSSFIFMDAVVI